MDSSSFLFPHRSTRRPALGAANPRLRSPRLGISISGHRAIAHLFAVSVAAAQHELCVSGSLAPPHLGACSNALGTHPAWSLGDLLLANASCVPACFSFSSPTGMKEHRKERNSTSGYGHTEEPGKVRSDAANHACRRPCAPFGR